jgi:hypothetical protein
MVAEGRTGHHTEDHGIDTTFSGRFQLAENRITINNNTTLSSWNWTSIDATITPGTLPLTGDTIAPITPTTLPLMRKIRRF